METNCMNQHWRNSGDYNAYLRANNLPENEVELTIKTYNPKTKVIGYNGLKSSKAVITFEESYDWVKPLVLNPTNLSAIEKIAGSGNPSAFIGLKITFVVDPTIKNPQTGEPGGIRVKKGQVKRIGMPKIEKGSVEWNNTVSWLKQGYTIEQILTKYSLTREQINELKRTSRE